MLTTEEKLGEKLDELHAKVNLLLQLTKQWKGSETLVSSQQQVQEQRSLSPPLRLPTLGSDGKPIFKYACLPITSREHYTKYKMPDEVWHAYAVGDQVLGPITELEALYPAGRPGSTSWRHSKVASAHSEFMQVVKIIMAFTQGYNQLHPASRINEQQAAKMLTEWMKVADNGVPSLNALRVFYKRSDTFSAALDSGDLTAVQITPGKRAEHKEGNRSRAKKGASAPAASLPSPRTAAAATQVALAPVSSISPSAASAPDTAMQAAPTARALFNSPVRPQSGTAKSLCPGGASPLRQQTIDTAAHITAVMAWLNTCPPALRRTLEGIRDMRLTWDQEQQSLISSITQAYPGAVTLAHALCCAPLSVLLPVPPPDQADKRPRGLTGNNVYAMRARLPQDVLREYVPGDQQAGASGASTQQGGVFGGWAQLSKEVQKQYGKLAAAINDGIVARPVSATEERKRQKA